MKNWVKYFVELLIVIVGVSIAFWLSQISDEQKETRTQNKYLTEIRSDLAIDIAGLQNAIEFNEDKIEKTYAVALLFKNADENKEKILDQAMLIGNYGFFQPTDFTYKSMIASGDFKLINDYGLKRNLMLLHSKYDNIELLQNNFIQALDEGFFPYILANFDYTTFQPVNDEMHKSLTVKNFFMFTINDLNLHVKTYKSALKTAEKLDSLISVQLQ